MGLLASAAPQVPPKASRPGSICMRVFPKGDWCACFYGTPACGGGWRHRPRAAAPLPSSSRAGPSLELDATRCSDCNSNSAPAAHCSSLLRGSHASLPNKCHLNYTVVVVCVHLAVRLRAGRSSMDLGPHAQARSTLPCTSAGAHCKCMLSAASHESWRRPPGRQPIA